MIIVGELFAGISGFGLGFERAGMRVAWQVEIDAKAREVLERHFPDAARFEDVTKVGDLEPVDLICGGFPCQDVSVAGKRAGLAGKRSGLWSEFHRIIALNRPRWVVIENVPGLLSSNGGRDFAVILSGLVELRYGVAWRILDSQYFGVAQRRRRVFIVGSLGDGCAAEILFEREGRAGHSAPRRETGARVARAVARGSVGSGYRYDANGEDFCIAWDNGQGDPNADEDGTAFALNSQSHAGVAVAQSLTAHHSRSDPDRRQYVAHALRAEADASEDGTGRGTPLVAAPVLGFDLAQITSKANYSNPQYGDPMPPLNLAAQSHVAQPLRSNPYNNSDPGMEAGMHVFDWQSGGDVRLNVSGHHTSALHAGQTPAVAGTLPADYYKQGGNGMGEMENEMVPQNVGVRRLTPTECARLQGFPDDWNDWLSDSARYRQFGNAVTVNVAEWIGRRIVEVGEHRDMKWDTWTLGG